MGTFVAVAAILMWAFSEVTFMLWAGHEVSDLKDRARRDREQLEDEVNILTERIMDLERWGSEDTLRSAGPTFDPVVQPPRDSVDSITLRLRSDEDES